MRRRDAGLLAFAVAIVAASLLTEARRDVAAAFPSAGERNAGNLLSARRGSESGSLQVDLWLARLKERSMNTEPSGPGLFGGATWQPRPKPGSDRPSKPPTPPFPFGMLGRMTLDGVVLVVFSKGDQSYTARVGQVLEQFRIDRIDDDGLRATYLPSGEPRDYGYEELYAANAAASPAPPVAMQSPEASGPQVVLPFPGVSLPQAPVPAPPAAGNAVVPGPAASGVSSSLDALVQGAAAPIGGMVVNDLVPPALGVVSTRTSAAGPVLTPPASTSGLQGRSDALPGPYPAPAPQ